MKNLKKIFIWNILLISLVNTHLLAYSKPTNNEIRQAIENLFQSNVPMTWTNSWNRGHSGKIDRVKVVKWGYFNQEHKYWPIIIHVFGSVKTGGGMFDLNIITRKQNKSKLHRINKTGKFKLYKDDYGAWKASFAR